MWLANSSPVIPALGLSPHLFGDDPPGDMTLTEAQQLRTPKTLREQIAEEWDW